MTEDFAHALVYDASVQCGTPRPGHRAPVAQPAPATNPAPALQTHGVSMLPQHPAVDSFRCARSVQQHLLLHIPANHYRVHRVLLPCARGRGGGGGVARWPPSKNKQGRSCRAPERSDEAGKTFRVQHCRQAGGVPGIFRRSTLSTASLFAQPWAKEKIYTDHHFLSPAFLYRTNPPRRVSKVDRKDLQGVPDFLLARIPQPDQQPSHRFTLLTDQSVMADVLKNARSGSLRRAMYLAGNSVAAENVEVWTLLVPSLHADPVVESDAWSYK